MGTHPIFESDFDCLTEMFNFEKLLFEINDYGRYQKFAIILLQFSFLAVSPMYQMGSVFYALKPEYTCTENIINQTDFCSHFSSKLVESSRQIRNSNQPCTSDQITACYRPD